MFHRQAIHMAAGAGNAKQLGSSLLKSIEEEPREGVTILINFEEHKRPLARTVELLIEHRADPNAQASHFIPGPIAKAFGSFDLQALQFSDGKDQARASRQRAV